MNKYSNLVNISPPNSPQEIATLQQLEGLLDRNRLSFKITVGSGLQIEIPDALYEALEAVIHSMASGATISISTQEFDPVISRNTDKISRFFQDEGFYEDSFIDECMKDLKN